MTRMIDRYHACRFWPDCEIHRGEQAPRTFTEDNAAQMAEDLADGFSLAEIAAAFGTQPGSVATVIRHATLRRNR